MVVTARNIRRAHIRRLDTLSRNECAAPNCTRALIAHDQETIISKICHIEAAKANGPRYNPNMTDDDRRHFNNLILLCDECHSIIDNKDNESMYPVSLLREWKKEHESTTILLLNSKGSLLKLALDAIASADFEDHQNDVISTPQVFKIENKLKYNSVIRNRALLDEYKVFYKKIGSLYAELEAQGSFKKENLLRNIKKIYLKIRGKYVGNSNNSLAIIQSNADNIIEDIEEKLIESCDSYHSTYEEDISFGVSIIMVDAFMRCKILEEPPKQ